MSQPPSHSTPNEPPWEQAGATQGQPWVEPQPVGFDASHWDPSYTQTPYGAAPVEHAPRHSAPPADPAAPYGAAPPYGAPFNAEAPYGAAPRYGAPFNAGAPYGAASPYGASSYPAMPYAAPLTAKPKLSGSAVASVIFGLIGGVLFSIGFGIRALVRIKRGDRRGKGLAVTGLTLSAVWLCIFGLLGAYAAGRAPTRSSAGTVTRAGTVSPLDLHVGDCVSVPLTMDTKLRSMTVVPCSQSHNGQVFTQVDATNASYPGDDALKQQALADCAHQAEAFLGTTRTLLNVLTVVPESEGWDLGDRTEQCLLVDRRREITGDIRNDR